MSRRRRLFTSACALLPCFFEVCAAQETCYPPGGVAGIVVATIIVTFVVGGLGAAVAYKLWTRKKGHKIRDRVDGQHHQKQSQKSNTEFAFDNPYFHDPEATDREQTNKGKDGMTNNKNSLRSSKLSEISSKSKKPRSGKNHFMFGGGGKKHRALDDSCLSVTPERTIVSLRGHDFTGLGFNICGNMRDGILVKDVLHRGPASESGLIKAGDKIINVTVSFTNIVYEDALTILSYASPYDVQLEIERITDKSRALPNTPSGSKRLGSCSFNNSGQKLFHPLYRSQSIDDLTQIDKDTFPSHGVGPRRSQSVGVAAHKLAAHFKNSDSKLEDKERSAGSLMLSTTGSLNEKMLANVMSDGNLHKNGLQWEKRFEDTLESEDSASNNDTQITNVDTSKQSNKSILKASRGATENVSDSSDEHAHCSQNYKQNIKYLDSPHQRGKLEPFKSSGGDKSETPSEPLKSGRAKTMAEASNALWHLDQSIKEGDVSVSEYEESRSSLWNQSKRDKHLHAKSSTPILKNNRYAKRGEENDSDVSNDSLEISNKKKGIKQHKKSSCAVHSTEIVKDDVSLQERKNLDSKSSNSVVKQNQQQKISKKNTQHNDMKIKNKSDNSTKNDYSCNSERVYANNIINKSASPNNISCMNDDQKLQNVERQNFQDSRDTKHTESNHYDIEHKQSTVYANHRDTQDNMNSRNTQKIVITDPSGNYGKVNGRNIYSERQKLSSAENYAQNYGCTNRVTINGETDEHKSKFIPNSKSNAVPKSTAASYQTQEENTRGDTDGRYLDKNKSSSNQKLVKKSAQPAGMFTQINPFQQPSRQKNANFKIWTGREDIKDSPLNSNESTYSASTSSNYVPCDSSHLNRRDYVVESQNYGQRVSDVPKTVLISSYENTSGRSLSGAQNSPLNYRHK